MFDISAFEDHRAAQDRGLEVTIMDAHGFETEIKMRIAGPDSGVQRRARHGLIERYRRLPQAERTSESAKESFAVELLAGAVLGWSGIAEKGQALPFTHTNVVRLLTDYPWVREQVDLIAGSREAFLYAPVEVPPEAEG
jgi:hypothetical protein